MDFPHPAGWTGGKTDGKIISGQRGFRPIEHHGDPCDDSAELTFDEFDYRNMGSER